MSTKTTPDPIRSEDQPIPRNFQDQDCSRSTDNPNKNLSPTNHSRILSNTPDLSSKGSSNALSQPQGVNSLDASWDKKGDRLPASVLEEFQQSAIPNELTLANVEHLSDVRPILTETAIAHLGGHSDQYVTKPEQRILDRYEFATNGGWVTWGQTLDGETGAIAYVKPDKPRPKREFKGFGPEPEQKVVKYETPQGLPGLPILVCVPVEFGQKIANKFGKGDEYKARTKDITDIDFGFWTWSNQDTSIPITIVEGFKKALSLIAQGVPAIAIRGIAMWHKKGSRELHDAIATFATPGRTVYIAFDQDEKTKTQLDVMGQGLALGEAIEKAGAKVSYLNWDRREGKGIDDAIYSQGDNAAQWLDGIVQNAINRKTYSRMRLSVQALAIIDRHNQSRYQITRITDGADTPDGYMPELPHIQMGAINVIDAGTGSGKTTRIGADWLDKSRFTLVISPTNAVGEQTANDWGTTPYPPIPSTGQRYSLD